MSVKTNISYDLLQYLKTGVLRRRRPYAFWNSRCDDYL